MFGDPSGLAPEPIQKGGTGDVLLGDTYASNLLASIMQSSVASVSFTYRIPVFGFYWDVDYREEIVVEKEGILTRIKQVWHVTDVKNYGLVGYETVSRTETGGGGPSGGGEAGGSIGGGGSASGGANGSGGVNDNGIVDNTMFDYEEVKASREDLLSFQETSFLESDQYLRKRGEESPFYNCHWWAWRGQDSDFRQVQINPHWDNSPVDEMSQPGVIELGPEDPIRKGDIVVYAFSDDFDKIMHSGVVEEVTDDGKVVSLISKWGPSFLLKHHPAHPLAEHHYGSYRKYHR